MNPGADVIEVPPPPIYSLPYFYYASLIPWYLIHQFYLLVFVRPLHLLQKKYWIALVHILGQVRLQSIQDYHSVGLLHNTAVLVVLFSGKNKRKIFKIIFVWNWMQLCDAIFSPSFLENMLALGWMNVGISLMKSLPLSSSRKEPSVSCFKSTSLEYIVLVMNWVPQTNHSWFWIYTTLEECVKGK